MNFIKFKPSNGTKKRKFISREFDVDLELPYEWKSEYDIVEHFVKNIGEDKFNQVAMEFFLKHIKLHYEQL